MRPCSSTNTPSLKPVSTPADPSSLNYHSPIFCEDFIVSD
ncbi:type IV toxin-antitoxin system YeeU family antitoxin, partial [Escherichia coli]